MIVKSVPITLNCIKALRNQYAKSADYTPATVTGTRSKDRYEIDGRWDRTGYGPHANRRYRDGKFLQVPVHYGIQTEDAMYQSTSAQS